MISCLSTSFLCCGSTPVRIPEQRSKYLRGIAGLGASPPERNLQMICKCSIVFAEANVKSMLQRLNDVVILKLQPHSEQ